MKINIKEEMHQNYAIKDMNLLSCYKAYKKHANKDKGRYTKPYLFRYQIKESHRVISLEKLNALIRKN